MKGFVALVAGSILAIGAPVQAAVPESPALPPLLGLAEALRILREQGLDLLVADASVRSAEGDLVIAGAVPDPGLSVSYGRSRSWRGCVDAAGTPSPCTWTGDPLYQASLSDNGAIEGTLTRKRSLRVEVARRALAAARAGRADAQRTVEGQLKQQFVQAVVAREALRFSEEAAASSARTLELTRHRYEAGAINEADLARVEVAALESARQRDLAGQALADAKAALAFLLGVRGATPPFDPEGPEILHPDQARARDAPASAELLARAREARPDLRAARAQRERAEVAAALARRQRFPDVSLTGAYSQQGTTPQATTPPTFTIGLSFALPIFYQQQGEIQKAEADRETQGIAAAKAEAQVTEEVQQALADWRTASLLVERMEGGLVERARRARDLVEVQYRKGAATLLDFLDAQRTFIASRVEYLQDLQAYWSSRFRLEQAVGEELR